MADPIDMIMGAGLGAPVIGGLVWALSRLGSRSVQAYDKTLEHLEKSIKDQGSEMKQLLGELTREMRTLRDTDIRQAEQIGALQKGLENQERRVDGQGAHYRQLLEEHRKAIFDHLRETVAEITKRTKR